MPSPEHAARRSAHSSSVAAREIRVRGIVQGVGFRPTVWRLAHQHALAGTVRNDADGVLIRAWGDPRNLDAFIDALRAQAPPLARIDRIDVVVLDLVAPATGFTIEASPLEGGARTFVSPDAATCEACMGEVFNPADRRAGYAFTNCTHCGPRLSIIRAIPYDRANTSMAAFPLCASCRREYDDPTDRRFHAQPNACPTCGPRLWLEDGAGEIAAGDPIAAAAERLRAGEIVAIKGIGGFHLAVDATNAQAVRRLRLRKFRPDKPLALIARDLDVVRRWRDVNQAEAAALTNRAAPIVLLERAGPQTLPDVIAPGSGILGFMLPMSALHHLLLVGFEHPLVLTSGNVSGNPQCTDNADAREHLARIADVFLMHDREIVNRLDDSVLRPMAGRARVLRRSRGFAPEPLMLPPGVDGSRRIIALGGELKNTFCLIRAGQALLSQHIGDLENVPTQTDYRKALGLYQQLFDQAPEALAIDLHPDYAASKLGRAWAAADGLQLIEVQHHHAHIAACLAEQGYPAHLGPVLGVALDGLGYGDDGALWGGELLLADYREARRLARLQPVALAGGGSAMREPWRNLAAQLLALPDWDHLRERHASLPLFQRLAAKPLGTLQRMIAHRINAPAASSCGRLFDAVAAALGLNFDYQTYEGQAATALEQLAWRSCDGGAYPFDLVALDGMIELQPAPMWRSLLDDMARGVELAAIARRFHSGLAQAWSACIETAAQRWGCQHCALTGGVFQNRMLFEAMHSRLEGLGLNVLSHQHVPANDGGLALGQAIIAAVRGSSA
ncbi:carbamoyltransferase HypF [Thiomonas sp. FB-Cd]|uniref:carbamoyltransferase HypF n=1 Tax=Thiomonas sp. FB-Cd TaxID=1158292 RepID=UPI0009DFF9FA|nr:carbamoyltransferase HypF [Thiomonas sp. FB-Cd]